jgi:hypothetical protein
VRADLPDVPLHRLRVIGPLVDEREDEPVAGGEGEEGERGAASAA